MNHIIKIFLLIFIYNVNAAPVRKNEDKSKEQNAFADLHYKNYLEEVLKELEKDKIFSAKVKEAQNQNQTEHIAQSLLFVNHQIRNQLDEIKRKEIERLNLLENEVERRKHETTDGDANLSKMAVVDKEHLDHQNVRTFEISDLEKLIKKTEEDLMKVDQEQEEEYKRHEMKKAYLKKKKLSSIKTEEERKKMAAQFEDSEKRHRNHSKVHHPGSEEQLKEVWDKNDHLDPNEFNPKAFFSLHDVNGDGHLDISEIESLMQNELSKVYDPNNTDDDMVEKYHEMMRMRHEMINIMDSNKDNLVSRDEFLNYTASTKFKDDPEWKTQEEEPAKTFSDKDYKTFEDDYSQHEDEDDDFSDQVDSLRFIPQSDMDAAKSADAKEVPSNQPIVQNDNQKGGPANL